MLENCFLKSERQAQRLPILVLKAYKINAFKKT